MYLQASNTPGGAMNSEGRITRAEAQRRKAHQQDIEAAQRILRASSLPKPKLGPRVAR